MNPVDCTGNCHWANSLFKAIVPTGLLETEDILEHSWQVWARPYLQFRSLHLEYQVPSFGTHWNKPNIDSLKKIQSRVTKVGQHGKEQNLIR